MVRGRPPVGSTREQVSAWLTSLGIRHKYYGVRRDPRSGEFYPSVHFLDAFEDDAFEDMVAGCIHAEIVEGNFLISHTRATFGFLFDADGKLMKSRLVVPTFS